MEVIVNACTPVLECRFLSAVTVAFFTTFCLGGAVAQSYPSRNITIIVPFPAGGLVDAAARLLQPELEKTLGRTVIVENRAGAAGVVGTAAVAKSEPDGYTLLVVTSSHTTTPVINAKISYDTERDLAPIAIVARDPLLFVVSKDVAAKTLSEFVALAKAEPGKLSYATPGYGSGAHFVTELLGQRAGLDGDGYRRNAVRSPVRTGLTAANRSRSHSGNRSGWAAAAPRAARRADGCGIRLFRF
jgi:tripartite-type tricarboxylate transporter receptor subunit TctC